MLDRQRDGLKEAFTVLGSTGNVYTVTIDKLPGCNCPDASKGNHCKHLIFVFLKCLAVKEESGLHYQKCVLLWTCTALVLMQAEGLSCRPSWRKSS